MPMCQSPRIDQASFRTQKIPANDNFPSAETGSRLDQRAFSRQLVRHFRSSAALSRSCCFEKPVRTVMSGVSVRIVKSRRRRPRHDARSKPRRVAAWWPRVCCPCAGRSATMALLGTTVAKAQDAEPRSYSNTPVGLNFLIAGCALCQGQIGVRSGPVDRRRQFPLRDRTAGLCPVVRFRGQVGQVRCDRAGIVLRALGFVDGLPREREMAGLLDPRFRVSVNLIGAPALSVKEFANYRQDLIVGVSLQVSAPVGQYDNSKLLNLGNNRWSFRPELGISKAVGPWTFELAPSVTFFTDNTDFFGGNNFAQAPFYTVQGHILYKFKSGAWLALDGVYFSGGRTTLNGVKSDNEQRNTRAGFTFALPVDRHNSLKLHASTGVTTRTGSDFTAVGVAWQYRWGDGY